ncbi:MAG: antitoxin, partial [Firmicutes bacterium]|nr:antitoxin [Bacillota bacterium]
ELTDEQLKKFEKASDPKYDSNTNQIVTLQLSPKTFEKAKSLGNDYTVILSRIIENVLNDNEMIEHFL